MQANAGEILERTNSHVTIPSPPDPDGELLARIAAYDQEAFQWFYDTFVGPVRAKLAAAGLGRYEYEELADDVLYEAVRKLAGYSHEKGRFITWLLTIAKRRAIDYQRRRGWEKVDGRYVPPDESLEALESRTRRRRAVGEGMDADEEAVLRYIKQRAAPEVGLDGEAAETAVDRAITELRAWLDAQSVEDRIAAEFFMYDTSWDAIAAKLSWDGKTVSPQAAKQRGYRLKNRAKNELGYLTSLFDRSTPTAMKHARESATTRDMDGV